MLIKAEIATKNRGGTNPNEGCNTQHPGKRIMNKVALHIITVVHHNGTKSFKASSPRKTNVC